MLPPVLYCLGWWECYLFPNLYRIGLDWFPGMLHLWSTGCKNFRIAMNVTQYKIVNLLKTLWHVCCNDSVFKLSEKFRSLNKTTLGELCFPPPHPKKCSVLTSGLVKVTLFETSFADGIALRCHCYQVRWFLNPVWLRKKRQIMLYSDYLQTEFFFSWRENGDS